jgi:hypothetical protein
MSSDSEPEEAKPVLLEDNPEITKSLEEMEIEMEGQLDDASEPLYKFGENEPSTPTRKRSIIEILFKHQFIRFVFSSILGSVIFYLLYELMFSILSYSSIQHIQIYRASISWFFCYIISIWFQHALHQAIVFYEVEISYLKSLFWTYLAYSLSIVFTPILIYFMTEMGIHHRVSWLIGLIVTGVFNYFAMKVSFWCSHKIDDHYKRINQKEKNGDDVFTNDALELEENEHSIPINQEESIEEMGEE